jgi:hypothetical protein
MLKRGITYWGLKTTLSVIGEWLGTVQMDHEMEDGGTWKDENSPAQYGRCANRWRID